MSDWYGLVGNIATGQVGALLSLRLGVPTLAAWFCVAGGYAAVQYEAAYIRGREPRHDR